MKKVAGFFDVNRVRERDAVRLEQLGWFPVNGPPKIAVEWQRPWIQRLMDWLFGHPA